MSDIDRAWELIRAESLVWAMAPDKLIGLAAAIAKTPEAGDDIWFAETPQRQLSNRGRPKDTPATVAVIPITGPLVRRGGIFAELFGLATYTGIRAQIGAALSDRTVDRIVLYTDSPGGSAMGCEEVTEDVRRAGRIKPVIAYVDGLDASAAYWITSAANSIVATPSGEIGSIGVFQLHADYSKMLDSEGIVPTFIKSKISPFKTEANPYEPLGDEAKAALQRDVDIIAGRFVSAVAKGRGVGVEKVRADFGKGRVLFANDAQRAGMIDGIGDFTAALKYDPVTARRAKLEAFKDTDEVGKRARLLQLLRAE